jgi:hypothetical protein
MAPEVMLGRPASVASDIYSLGVLLYYLVTGTFPIEGKSWSDFLIGHARGDRRPIGDIRPDVPADFARVVDKATARLPEERFQTPGALLTALSETMPKLVTPPAPVTAPEPETVSTSEGTISIDRRLLLAGLAVAGIWGLGAITSIVFNHTLGRSGEFATESILSWWVWGFRALIPGTVYVVMVLLAVWAARALWRLITRTVPPARRAADSGTFFIQRFSERTGFNTPSALAEALLIFQVIAVVAFCWYFVDIFSAMASFVETASAEDLEPMRPDHRFRHQIYGQSMAMLILAMAVGIQLVRRWQRIRGFAPSMKPFRANLAAMAVAFVVLVLPYRLMWQNRVEVAVYQDMRCYILADSGPAVRLYCPTSAVPRTRRVAQVDPTFTRTGQVENLYTRPTSSIPGR